MNLFVNKTIKIKNMYLINLPTIFEILKKTDLIVITYSL